MTTTAANDHSRRWLILAVLGVAQLMVVLDATIVSIALPSAQASLDFSDSSRQWVVTAYTLSFGSLLLLGGRLSDLFGRRRALLVGLAGFAVASALAGLAPSFGALIAARAVQGVFAALLAPTTLSLLTTTFTDPEERGKAFGIFGAIAGSGAAVGLLLGGILTEYLSWRWCLYVNLIFAGVAAAGALVLVSNQARSSRPRLDIPGTLAGSLGLFAIVYGFSEADRSGWGAASTIGFLATGVTLLAAFVAIERRVQHPLLPLRIVTDRDRAGSYLAILVSMIGMFGASLFLTFYLQQTLAYSPVEAGLAFLPMVGVLVISSTTASTVLLRRVGAKVLIASGMVLAAIAMGIFAQLEVDSTYVGHVLPGLVVLGAGLGLLFAVAINTATAKVGSDDAGVASATVNTSQQVGGSLGTALLNTVATTATTAALAGGVGSPAALAAATVHGYTVAFWWAAAIFVGGAVICGLILRPLARQVEPAAEPATA